MTTVIAVEHFFSQDRTVQQCQTLICGSERFISPGDRHGKSSFVSGDIVKQLKQVVEKEENIEVLTNRSARGFQKEIYDIPDGILYRNLEKSGEFLDRTNNIT